MKNIIKGPYTPKIGGGTEYIVGLNKSDVYLLTPIQIPFSIVNESNEPIEYFFSPTQVPSVVYPGTNLVLGNTSRVESGAINIMTFQVYGDYRNSYLLTNQKVSDWDLLNPLPLPGQINIFAFTTGEETARNIFDSYVISVNNKQIRRISSSMSLDSPGSFCYGVLTSKGYTEEYITWDDLRTRGITIRITNREA